MELGGYFSIKRNAMSIPGDTFLAVDQVVPYCKALLEVFRCASATFSACASTVCPCLLVKKTMLITCKRAVFSCNRYFTIVFCVQTPVRTWLK